MRVDIVIAAADLGTVRKIAALVGPPETLHVIGQPILRNNQNQPRTVPVWVVGDLSVLAPDLTFWAPTADGNDREGP